MLADFQMQFATQVLQPCVAASSDMAPDAAALSVYRNTVMKGLVDALAANFPAVQRLVGEEWFAAAASCFARQCLPSTPVLALYGASFAEFLAEFPPATELPYLAEVARLDRLWIETYFAADTPPLTAHALQTFDQHRLFAATIELHPAVRCGVFKHSAVDIWIQNHPSLTDAATADCVESVDAEQAALLTRPDSVTRILKLSDSDYLFVSKLQQHVSLGEAAVATLEHDPQFPVAPALARLIGAGAFSGIHSSSR